MTYRQLVEQSILNLYYGFPKEITGANRETVLATIRELKEGGIEKKLNMMLEVNGNVITKYPQFTHQQIMTWDELIKKRGNAQEESLAYYRKLKKVKNEEFLVVAAPQQVKKSKNK